MGVASSRSSTIAFTWEAERPRSPASPSGVHCPVPTQRPLISISRQCGSRGGELGRLVAERLSFSFYSQELVHEIATAAHVRSGAVETFDEHPRGGLETMVREILDGEAFAAPRLPEVPAGGAPGARPQGERCRDRSR